MENNKETILNTKPEINIFWRGLGGHFDSISQILNEFIDNSISNYKGNRNDIKQIIINIKENKDSFAISVEDTGRRT